MTIINQIEQLLAEKEYLLEDDDLPSYGEMPNVGAIARAIELGKKHLKTLTKEQDIEVRRAIKRRLWDCINLDTALSTEELEEHDYDEDDWETMNWLYREVDDSLKTAIDQICSDYLSEDTQKALLFIIGNSTLTSTKLFAAQKLENYESLRVRDGVEPVLLKVFDDYDPLDRPCGRTEQFCNCVVRILTERLLWSEEIELMLKRTKQFEFLTDYAGNRAKTLNWYIDTYLDNSKITEGDLYQVQEEQVILLKALAIKWQEKTNLMPFLHQQLALELEADTKAQLIKILFLNFPYHTYTIETLRQYLVIEDEEADDYLCTMRSYDIVEVLNSYSDSDIPQKRQMLEHYISERIGDLHKAIEVYTWSYGYTDETFAFFIRCLEAAKEGHKTGLLNLFLRNFPDDERTAEIRKRYKRLM